MSVRAAVRLVIELQLGQPTVTDDQRLVDDLGADSFDVMNIIAVLEENHGITITEEAAAALTTVREICDLVTGLVEP